MDMEASDIAEGIVQDRIPQHLSPRKNDFAPWHKPRKQYIRRYQWNALAKEKIRGDWRHSVRHPATIPTNPEPFSPTIEPVRCLIIPGNHLLDMRSMWNEIGPLRCHLKYLGFNASQGSGDVGTDVHVANNALIAFRGVSRESHVVKDRFESITNTSSMAYRSLRKYGPYHIVNLDLCDSVLPGNSPAFRAYYKAIHRLLEYQSVTQRLSWLLYVTTHVQPSTLNEVLMVCLVNATEQNLGDPRFAKEFCEKIADVRHGSTCGKIQLSKLGNEGLLKTFGVAFGKWLIHLGQSSDPKWTVKMHPSYRYTVNQHEAATMLSLAFELSPNFVLPVDDTGLAESTRPESRFMSEVDCALTVVESVAGIEDVDQQLSKDEERKGKIMREAADLMESAGFDRKEYLIWAGAD